MPVFVGLFCHIIRSLLPRHQVSFATPSGLVGPVRKPVGKEHQTHLHNTLTYHTPAQYSNKAHDTT